MSPTRFLGLELGGGKSNHTDFVLLEFYEKEKKIFLANRLPQSVKKNFNDETLIKQIQDQKPHHIAISAPLGLPPCLVCTLPQCPGFKACAVAEVQWIHKEAAKLPKHPTPYTQRGGDVYLRSRIQPHFSHDLFIEETLGARAPLASRAQYLKRRLKGINFIEVHPRTTVLGLARWFRIPDREIRRYRDLEEGVEYRLHILNRLEKKLKPLPHLFLYNSDKQYLAKQILSFHALLGALMAVYQTCGFAETFPGDYDPAWGSVAIPKLSLKA